MMAQNIEEKVFFDRVATIISAVFHPLFMPVYGMIIIFSAPTLFGYLPFQVKKILLFIVLVNNVVLPLALLPFFKYRNIISSWSIDERSERIIPLSMTTLLYLTTSFIIFRFPIPSFLKSFMLAAFFLSLIVTVINLWWKISIHALGAGALTALVLMLSFKLESPLIWYLIPVILASGMVLASRLKLNTHNPEQVWSGFLMGSLGMGTFMWFL
jgi:hypothetical protein